MTYLAVAVVAVALGGTSMYLRGLFAHSLEEKTALVEQLHGMRSMVEQIAMGSDTASEQPADAEWQRSVEQRLEDLTLAVAEGIAHVERAENRVRTVVRRARKEFEEGGFESAGVEAEYAQLSVLDGGGSVESGMPPMPQEVAAHQESSIPGVSSEALARARGLG